MYRTAARFSAFLALTVAFPVQADELADVRKEISSLEERIGTVEAAYLKPALLERRYEFTTRLSDGQLFFIQKQYDRAAIVLLDLVESSNSEHHPGYKDAIYYAAESLFRLRNFKASSQLFESLSKRGTRSQKQQALGRLLEIALVTNDVEAARAYLQRTDRMLSSAPEPALVYAVGKYYYTVGDLKRASTHFERVSSPGIFGLKARYFSGVVAVKRGEFDNARVIFTKLIAEPVELEGEDTSERRHLINLGHLATARIHYERGEFDKAVISYANVPRGDDEFQEAIYESVWISIKKKEYERALRKLEIQLISQPDVVKGPDTRLLQGKLLMMLDRYDGAADAFQEVLYEFGPIHRQMNDILRKYQGDLEGHFNRLIGESIEDFDLDTFLPAGAARFAGPEVSSDRALLLVGDLADQKRDVIESRRVIGQLDAALAADNRVEIFPRLHQGWLQAIEINRRSTRVRGRLNDIAGEGVASVDYIAFRAERKRWEKRYQTVPLTAAELSDRDNRVEREMRKLDQELYKSEIDIQSLEFQLAAIDRYVTDAMRKRGLASSKDRNIRARVELELAESQGLRDKLRKLQIVVDEERIRVGVNDYATREDESVRRRYLNALTSESRWLEANGRGGGAERKRLDAVDNQVNGYLEKAAVLVDERVAKIRDTIDLERGNVQQYDGELVAFQGETRSLGGSIAARSFQRVLERIDTVVLAADVGLIDVAWKQKEDKSTQIGEMLGRQTIELKNLDRSFKEVKSE